MKQTQTKKKQTLLICFLSLCSVVLLVLFLSLYMAIKTEPWMVTEADVTEHEYDCILVLGAGIRDDGTPSLILQKRLDCAISLYHAGICDKLLMSGDHSREDYDEVNTMKQYAMENGVPEEAIYLDHAGFSTYESIYRAKELFGISRPLIVTQKYHLFRALYIADKFGMTPYGAVAEGIHSSGNYVREARECIARVKDFFTCIFKPNPTYLGDTIDLNGPASQTNG